MRGDVGIMGGNIRRDLRLTQIGTNNEDIFHIKMLRKRFKGFHQVVNDAFPATLTSGFGFDQVCGRIRVPRPAIGMTIFKLSDMFFSCL